MKRYIGIILTIVTLFHVTSCSHDFLDEVPFSTIVKENFYETEADAEMALIGCYSALTTSGSQGERAGLFHRQFPFIASTGNDEAIHRAGVNTNDWTLYSTQTNTSASDFGREMWGAAFVGINRCNSLLEEIDDIEMDAARKTEMRAEARFLRGLYHMYLAMLFGGVPVVDSSVPEPNAARQPLSEVYSFVMEDFQFAYENLNHRNSRKAGQRSINGRANKWAAAGFLAKTCLYLASAKTYGQDGGHPEFVLNSFNWVDAPAMYTRALELTTDIVTNGGFDLMANYKHLFYESLHAEKQLECLFVLENSPAPEVDNQMWLHNTFLPSGTPRTNGGGQAYAVPTGEMWERYHVSDLRRSHNLTRQIQGPAQAPVEEVGGQRYYVPLAVANPTSAAFFIGKFRYRDPATKALPPTRTDGDYPLLRFADILLSHAEAVYGATGDAASARTFLSRVRVRATTAPTTAVLDLQYQRADFIDELLEERSRELCFEGQRRFDLFRFNRYESAIQGLTTDNSKGFNNATGSVAELQTKFKPYRVWLPVPLIELDINKSFIPNPEF